jgi:DNA repair ATPase RecN
LDKVDPEEYSLQDLGFPTPPNWLPSAPSALKGLETDYEGIVRKLDNVLNGINKFLEALDYETTGKRVKEVFEDTRSAVADVRKAARRIQEVLDKKAIDAIMKDGQVVIQDTRDLVKQIKSGTHSTTAEMEKAFKSLDETSRKAAAVFNKIDQELAKAGVAKVALSARQAFDRGAAAAESVSELRSEAQRAIRELNATLRTLRRFIDYMERNPDALLSGKREPAP